MSDTESDRTPGESGKRAGSADDEPVGLNEPAGQYEPAVQAARGRAHTQSRSVKTTIVHEGGLGKLGRGPFYAYGIGCWRRCRPGSSSQQWRTLWHAGQTGVPCVPCECCLCVQRCPPLLTDLSARTRRPGRSCPACTGTALRSRFRPGSSSHPWCTLLPRASPVPRFMLVRMRVLAKLCVLSAATLSKAYRSRLKLQPGSRSQPGTLCAVRTWKGAHPIDRVSTCARTGTRSCSWRNACPRTVGRLARRASRAEVATQRAGCRTCGVPREHAHASEFVNRQRTTSARLRTARAGHAGGAEVSCRAGCRSSHEGTHACM